MVASDDGGRTRLLPESIARELVTAWEDATEVGGQSSLTAGAIASIAESKAARPIVRAGNQTSWRSELNGESVKLAAHLRSDSRPLNEVLELRRSIRDLGSPAISDLATILTRTHRVIDVSTGPDGYTTTHRPVPSGGARHPIDLHLLAAGVDGLEDGHYVFDALACDLVLVGSDSLTGLNRVTSVIASERTLSAAIFAVAHLDRTLSRYPTGISLVWRDAGAILATAHLCATDLGLQSCIVGSAGIIVDQRESQVLDVGCLAVGAHSDVA